MGGVQYRGGYHEYRGGYLEYWVMFSTVGDIMSTVEVFSTMGGYHPLKFEYRGGYHDTCGGIS